jgi:TonB family protein
MILSRVWSSELLYSWEVEKVGSMTDLFKFDWFDSQEDRNSEASREGQVAASRESAGDGVIHDLVDLVSTAIPIPKTEEDNARERGYHGQRDKIYRESLLPHFPSNDASSGGGSLATGSKRQSSQLSAISGPYPDGGSWPRQETYNAHRHNYEIRRGWAIALGWVVGFAFLEIAGPCVAQALAAVMQRIPNWLGVYIFLALWADAILFGVTTTRFLGGQKSALRPFCTGVSFALIAAVLVGCAIRTSTDPQGSAAQVTGTKPRFHPLTPARRASRESIGGQKTVGLSVKFAKPVPTYTPEPLYTEEGRQRKIQGDVVLRIVVDANGKVSDLKVFKSLEPTLDESTIQTIRTWTFKPATRDGVPVTSSLEIKTTFRLF